MKLRQRFEQTAADLRAARRSMTPVGRLGEVRDAPDLDGAYAAQAAVASALDMPTAGYKIGGASKVSQEFVGASEPFYGLLFGADMHASGATLRRQAFFDPGMEGEFAFRIGRDLPVAAAPFSVDDIAGAIDAVIPAIEVCDHRFRDWRRASLAEIVADNSFHGALVLGEPRSDWRAFDYEAHEIALAFDGETVGQGPGALVLGHPLNSVAWLANKLAGQGRCLKAGEIVAAGTCTGLRYAGAARHVSASLGAIGDVAFDLE